MRLNSDQRLQLLHVPAAWSMIRIDAESGASVESRQDTLDGVSVTIGALPTQSSMEYACAAYHG